MDRSFSLSQFGGLLGFLANTFVFKALGVAAVYNTNGCENLDGGGWTLVRHVSSTENGFHPATDHLLGSDSYGAFDGNAQSLLSYSVQYDDKEFTQFLFAFGDCSSYVIATKDSAIGEYYDHDDRCVLKSNYDNYPHRLDFMNRKYSSADPFISSLGDDICREGGCTLYAEGGYGANNQREYYLTGMRNHGGANVWIRNKPGDSRSCCEYSDSYRCTVYPADQGLVTFGETEDTALFSLNGGSLGWTDYIRSCNDDGILPLTIKANHVTCDDSLSGDDICINEVIAKITDGIETVGISFPSDGTTPIFKESSRNNGSPAIGTYTLAGKYYVTVSQTFFEISWDLEDGSGERGMVWFKYGGSTLGIHVADCVSDYVCGECNYEADSGVQFK